MTSTTRVGEVDLDEIGTPGGDPEAHTQGRRECLIGANWLLMSELGPKSAIG